MMLRWDRVVVRGVAGLLTGHLRLDLRGMGAIVIAQGLWNLAVAA